jgi:radical SAM superfamily enzyme YgiQ (UPF0313 family)
MKILLAAINAKYIHSNPAVHILRDYAEEWKEQIEVAEYTINQLSEDILADIYNRKPDVVAFSCYIWNWKVVEELLPELPKVLPGIRLWLGGPEVTYDAPGRLAQYECLAGIMVGEGEETFAELAEYYCTGGKSNGKNHESETGGRDFFSSGGKNCDKNAESGTCSGNAEQKETGISATKRLEEIRGLCLPHYGYTGERAPLDMDKVPFIYEDLSAFEHKILYYETSRGCPFSCSYCLSSIDKKVRFRSLALVKKELQFFLDHKAPQVKFVDRTFNCSHAHACGIWSYILEHDNGVTNFHFEISADLLNEEELLLLSKMRPGLVQLEIGVQSTNGDTIQEIRRTMNLERLKSVVDRIHAAHNIHQHLDLIAGLPQEDFESFVRSFNEVYAMHPDQLQMGFLKVLKGSYMETRVDDYALQYTKTPPYEVLSTKWLTYGEVLRLKKVEQMVELYYNSNQFTHTLAVLEQAFDSPFAMFDALGDYFAENNLFLNKPARIYRYDVLLGFAVEHDSDREALYRELLTFDLYLRENCKSRPAFAAELAPYREELRRREPDRRNHIDVFYYPVWHAGQDGESGREAAKIVCRNADPYYVSFDYDHRDPLSNNAEISVQ